MSTNKVMVLPALTRRVEQLTKEFDQILPARKELLHRLTDFIHAKNKAGADVVLNFICTHNSRRSQLSQIWAQTAACYYQIPNVTSYSGGTEASAFDRRAVSALLDAGFNIAKVKESENPVYEVRFARNAKPVIAFSKKYDDPFNGNTEFAAIMTCSHADENCPVISGASQRITLPFEDPKLFDDTSMEKEIYRARTDEIGREILYAFSKV